MDVMGKLQQLLLKIPRGKVTTYKEIARALGIHSRAAGRLLGSNPDSKKYPCYKVVYADGRLGGYTSSTGLKEKVKRLKKDGIEVKNGRIAKKSFFYF
ncbi:MAG: MGMT family protein [Candidatus Aenigmatarchaeota archaeon]